MFVYFACLYFLFCLLDGEGQEKNHPYDSKYERYVYYLLFIKMFLFYLRAFCIIDWTGCSTACALYIFQCVLFMKFRHQHALLSIEAGHVTGLFQKKLFWNRSPWNIWCLNLSGRNYNMLNFEKLVSLLKKYFSAAVFERRAKWKGYKNL